MKHVICYSGGHSSALTAIEAKRLYGKENIVLLNHNINPRYEDEDIKRFKKEVADYLGIEITFANINGIEDEKEIPSQFDVCEEAGTFVNPNGRQILCTNRLKTQPFYDYLKTINKDEICVYYGFDSTELQRVDRRKGILKLEGIMTDFPLAIWGEDLVEGYNNFKLNELFKTFKKTNKTTEIKDLSEFVSLQKDFIQDAIKYNLIEITEFKKNKKRTIFSTEEIGIKPPLGYKVWKHANCIGCLKAGQQHWYCVYVHDYETFERAKLSEERIGHSFGNQGYLKDMEPKFKKMFEIGIPANEHIPNGVFWKSARFYLKQSTQDLFPCECFV